MRKFSAAVFAAILLLIALPALAGTTGIVRGIVFVNGNPQVGATVTLAGSGGRYTTLSGSDGQFVFPTVQFGHYQLTAHTPGYPDKTVAIDVASDSVTQLTIPIGTAKTISQTNATAGTGLRGVPVSRNALSHQQLSALPMNNSLNLVAETLPGIVQFSYNEPVAHGFHGITYEIDGAPLPVATSSSFAELIDPKNVDSLEIFTGAMPAEFGGSRIGAVFNITTNRANDLTVPYQGYASAGFGNQGQALASLDQAFKLGKTSLFLTMNAQKTARGIDAPTASPIHDNSSQADQFLRTVTDLGRNRTLSFDVSNQFAQFQVPINVDPNNPNDAQVNIPGTDDNQLDFDRFANLNLTLPSASANNILQIVPWVRYARVEYLGDLQADVQGTIPNPSFDPTQTAGPANPANVNLVGVSEDRRAAYAGLRATDLMTTAKHAIKAGIDISRENFSSVDSYLQSAANLALLPPGTPAAVRTGVAQAGTQTGLFAQDKWTPSNVLTLDYGIRYDHSTGFTSGNQISPRLGINIQADRKNILHFYYGRFYAAPQLEDVRGAFAALSGIPTLPVYDLQPETDSYYEMGVAHTFSPDISGYVNYWARNAVNVLDTTNFLNTSIQSVFNNAVGKASGFEYRLTGRAGFDSWYFSGSIAASNAGGVSGSTFLVGGPQLIGQLQPEDHDQTYAFKAGYTHRWGFKHALYATLAPDYGSGYPVQFQSGPGRLPTHLLLDASFGRDAGTQGDRSLGFAFDVLNVLNHQYVVKIANGFNTTQIANGRSFLFRITAPI